MSPTPNTWPNTQNQQATMPNWDLLVNLYNTSPELFKNDAAVHWFMQIIQNPENIAKATTSPDIIKSQLPSLSINPFKAFGLGNMIKTASEHNANLRSNTQTKNERTSSVEDMIIASRWLEQHCDNIVSSSWNTNADLSKVRKNLRSSRNKSNKLNSNLQNAQQLLDVAKAKLTKVKDAKAKIMSIPNEIAILSQEQWNLSTEITNFEQQVVWLSTALIHTPTWPAFDSLVSQISIINNQLTTKKQKALVIPNQINTLNIENNNINWLQLSSLLAGTNCTNYNDLEIEYQNQVNTFSNNVNIANTNIWSANIWTQHHEWSLYSINHNIWDINFYKQMLSLAKSYRQQWENYARRILWITMIAGMTAFGNANAQTITQQTQNQITTTIWQNTNSQNNTQIQPANQNSQNNTNNHIYNPNACEQIRDNISVTNLQNEKDMIWYANKKWFDGLWYNEKSILQNKYWISNNSDLNKISKQINNYFRY